MKIFQWNFSDLLCRLEFNKFNNYLILPLQLTIQKTNNTLFKFEK